jgi:hypothetical protein
VWLVKYYKTRAHEKVVQMAKSGRAKKHVLCSEGTVAGMGCKTLACALGIKVTVMFYLKTLTANGTAIK